MGQTLTVDPLIDDDAGNGQTESLRLKDLLGIDDVVWVCDNEWKCFTGDAEVDCIYVLMCKIVRNNNEAHNFLKVKMLDDDWDLEANEEFLVTSCLYVFGLIGDVENALLGRLSCCLSIPVIN